MPERHDHLDLAAILIMIACCACWGLNQVAIKVANTGISPIFQAGLRGLCSGMLVLIWAGWHRTRLFERDGSLKAGIAIGLVFAIEFILLYRGIVFTTASRAVVFMYIAPFVVAVGAHFLIPGERLGISQIAGLIAAFLGMLAAFGDALRLPTLRELTGDLMVTGAAVLWAVTTLLARTTRLNAVSPPKLLLYQLAGSVLLLPLGLAVGEPGFTAPSAWALAAFAYSAIGVAFASYLTWYWLIARYPAAKLSGFSFLAPLLGVLAGGALLGEPISSGLWAAMVLVALGMTLINRRPRAAARRFTATAPKTAADSSR